MDQDIEHRGLRWGFCFLVADAKLSADDRLDLVREAAEMYFEEESERSLNTKGYTGRIFEEIDHAIIGSFSGRQYGAELETPKGKARVHFLIREYTDVLHHAFSKN